MYLEQQMGAVHHIMQCGLAGKILFNAGYPIFPYFASSCFIFMQKIKKQQKNTGSHLNAGLAPCEI